MSARAHRAARLAGLAVGLSSVLGILATITPIVAQGTAPKGEWRYIGGDAWHTRYLPLDQIDSSNFDNLQVAWVWRGDNFGPAVDYVFRSTPIYVDGILYTVAGQRRTVAAIDPKTGETLWAYREPNTTRYERGMRNNYGKGVAYGEVNGRGVIYYTSPAFFLHALDAKTGEHLENWGTPRADTGVPAERRHRHASRSRQGLGTVDHVGPRVRPGKRDPA